MTSFARGFYIKLEDFFTDADAHLPHGLTFDPQRWGADDQRGFTQATINVTGDQNAIWQVLDFIGHIVEIHANYGPKCWRGRITQIRVLSSALALGYALDQMHNRVRAIYTYPREDGATERRTTDWQEFAPTVDRFGQFEHTLSLSNATDEEAIQAVAQEIERSGTLRTIFRPAGGSDETLTAEIRCEGLIYEFEKKHYAQDAGEQSYDTYANSAYPLGYGFTTSTLVFAEDDEIRDSRGYLTPFREGMRIKVYNTELNDGTYIVETGEPEPPEYYTSPTMYFTADDNLRDTEFGLQLLDGESMVIIENSPANSGVWGVDQFNAPDWVELAPNLIVDEGQGNLYLTVFKAQRVTLQQTTITEELLPPNVVIATDSLAMTQSFVVTTSKAWTVNDISIQMRKKNGPTDQVIMTLFESVYSPELVSTFPGRLLEASVVNSSEISDVALNWVTFKFSNTTLLEPGKEYWLFLSRASGFRDLDHYEIGYNEDAEHTGRILRFDGTNYWEFQHAGASMPFRARGTWETTQQIEEIVLQCGQRIDGVEIEQASGLHTNQYRSGDQLALPEVDALLQRGYSGGNRMLCEVTDADKLRIYPQPDADSSRLQYFFDGKITTKFGAPLQPGVLPIGEWCDLPQAPLPLGTALSPFRIKSIEYDARTDRYYPVPLESIKPASLGGILPG